VDYFPNRDLLQVRNFFRSSMGLVVNPDNSGGHNFTTDGETLILSFRTESAERNLLSPWHFAKADLSLCNPALAAEVRLFSTHTGFAA
jgi:hypothetical protein